MILASHIRHTSREIDGVIDRFEYPSKEPEASHGNSQMKRARKLLTSPGFRSLWETLIRPTCIKSVETMWTKLMDCPTVAELKDHG